MKIDYIIKIMQPILIPIGILYGLILQIRNWFFDWGILKSDSFSVPVISIGNITAGGTGKTPFTIYLAKELSSQFKKIAIVSRGYGRESSGLQLVAANGQVYLEAAEAGDEPYLMARSLPNCVIIVSEKRAEGIRLAQEKFQVDLIILDDAFQHRSVKRNLDILLMNTREPWKNNFPIPAGTLREFKFNFKRAQVIVFTNTDSDTILPFNPQNLKYFKSSTQLNEIVDPENRVVGTVTDFQSKKVLAFAGIAHPKYFFKALADKGLVLEKTYNYKDHHQFSRTEIEKILQQAKKRGAVGVLCTEKDMAKIKTVLPQNQNISILAVRLNWVMDNNEEFLKEIKRYIK